MTAHGVGLAGKVALFLATVALPATLLTPTASAVTALSMRGADVSTAQRALDLGAKYHDANGTARDPLDILKGAGVNYVRQSGRAAWPGAGRLVRPCKSLR